MLADLLVLLDPDTDVAGPYALWLADKLDAVLTATAPIAEPNLPTSFSAELPGEFLSKLREEAEDAARTVLKRFVNDAKQYDVVTETQLIKTWGSEIGREIKTAARYHDLTILSQANPDKGQWNDVIESALFGSGRPIIIVPYVFGDRAQLDTILIGWDGGQAAARALADALPLLRIARNVQIVTVADPSEEWVRRAHAALVRHLDRHEIAARSRTLIGSNDPANALLSHAADSGADLLVMGGYGHSRVREMVLGGATRAILRTMTVPVFMSH